MEKAIITVIGKDKVGIIAKVTNTLAECSINVLDITQTILQDMFTMMMIVDISKSDMDISAIRDNLTATGTELGVEIRIQHEDIFNSMHRI
ncbi:MAG: ACT domain-containing protein [Clostridia bacterium]|nr:ACT domain-containing protein [Clostridia bacterium]